MLVAKTMEFDLPENCLMFHQPTQFLFFTQQKNIEKLLKKNSDAKSNLTNLQSLKINTLLFSCIYITSNKNIKKHKLFFTSILWK